MNETSFWSARIELTGNATASSSIWDNPNGNPAVPPSPYNTPGSRRDLETSIFFSRQATVTNSSDIITYSMPIHYPVSKTGFYCVGMFLSLTLWKQKLMVVFITSCNTHYRPVPSSSSRQSPSIILGLRIVSEYI